jgi:hypothetical protein
LRGVAPVDRGPLGHVARRGARDVGLVVQGGVDRDRGVFHAGHSVAWGPITWSQTAAEATAALRAIGFDVEVVDGGLHATAPGVTCVVDIAGARVSRVALQHASAPEDLLRAWLGGDDRPTHLSRKDDFAWEGEPQFEVTHDDGEWSVDDYRTAPP